MTTETNNTPRRRPDGWRLTVPYRPEPPEKATTTFLNRALFHRYRSYFSPDDRTLALKLIRNHGRDEAEDWFAHVFWWLPRGLIALAMTWIEARECRDEVFLFCYRQSRDRTAADGGLPFVYDFAFEHEPKSLSPD